MQFPSTEKPARTIADLRVGDPVSIEPDPNNPVESDALTIVCRGQRIGYVNRALKHMFHGWLRSGALTATIERLNGKPEHPLVYARVGMT